ncbi:MAG: hypothetical protein RBG13Loki_1026 [Promethearchaeota archaeon CR_4]|nr:MAG: hypothetical protein RBG13Loki_1026 [Candidatus Lokiarchaeota archaeon CR_4]
MPKPPYDLSWLSEKSYYNHLIRIVEKLFARLGSNLQGILTFGSLAKGKAIYNEEHQSDIDLLVIAENIPINVLSRAKKEWEYLGLDGLGTHIIWKTSTELEMLVDKHRAFIFEVIRDGKIIYDPDNWLKELKYKVQELIQQLVLIETESAWVWPQKVPGSEIEW